MIKRLMIITLLMVLIIPLNVSCNQQQAQQPTAPVEAPPPDYTKIDAGMKDASDVVRMETLKDLLAIHHKDSIPRLIAYMEKDFNNQAITGQVNGALISYGADVVPIVKERLWNSDNISYQANAFEILSNVLQPPELMQEAKKKYDNIQPTPQNLPFRSRLITYYISAIDLSGATQANPAAGSGTATGTGTAQTSAANPVIEVINILKKVESDVAPSVIATIAAKKDPQIANLLTKFYFANLSDEETKLRILQVISVYDSPFAKPKTGYVPLNDFTVYLYSFANNNPQIHGEGLAGLKKYAYNDKEGQIIKFMKNFENCSDPNIRANVIEMERFILSRPPIEGEQMPTFTIPAPVKRADVCI